MAERLQISASEIEKYAYCPLNWWLYRQGVQAEGGEAEEGEVRHETLARRLNRVLSRESRTAEWETLVMFAALVASIVAIFGVTLLDRLDVRFAEILSVLALIWLLAAAYLLYRAETETVSGGGLVLERLLVLFSMVATLIALLSLSLSFWEDSVLATVLEVVALVWLVGASFFLYKTLQGNLAVREAREAAQVGEASIAYVDAPAEGAELLKSATHGVRGRPDFVIKEDGALIPVEAKTGRVPRGPLFSHILQVAAYCLLLHENSGVRPPYGLLRYGEVVHEIEYTEELETLLLDKLEEMRQVADRGEAHRNHRRKGKCRNCSRRHACPERLA